MGLVVRGRLLGGETGTVILDGDRIARVTRRAAGGARILRADIIAPGFVDLQVNGAFGVDVATGGPSALRVLRRRLPETGVTSFLPTLLSSPSDVIDRVRRDVAAVAEEEGGARILGLHLEGPFLSTRRAGAHPAAIIAAAGDEGLGGAALVTLAPERPGALELITRLVAGGTLVSLGHTDATHDEMLRGIAAGARLCTHLYNAMSPFSHREPGAVGAALTDDRLTAAVIADGVHCHPAAFRLAVRAKTARRIVLTTDAMAAAGMPPGEHTLGGQRVISDGEAARLADGTLAGSTLTMDRAVRNAVAWGVPLAAALRMAAEIPARLLGRNARLVPGAPADLVLLDEELRVTGTIIAGKLD